MTHTTNILLRVNSVLQNTCATKVNATVSDSGGWPEEMNGNIRISDLPFFACDGSEGGSEF